MFLHNYSVDRLLTAVLKLSFFLLHVIGLQSFSSQIRRQLTPSVGHEAMLKERYDV